MNDTTLPLFVCHANVSRSMLAEHLYRDLAGAPALSAGCWPEPGSGAAPATAALLTHWGGDCGAHRARPITRDLCDQATHIFTMAPHYSAAIFLAHGVDLAAKTYLFADPFTVPTSFEHAEYHVVDPGFDHRPTWQVVADHAWFRERVLAIRLALLGYSPRPLVPATAYLHLLDVADASR